MKWNNLRFLLLAPTILICASCETTPPEPKVESSVKNTPGVAGGEWHEAITSTALITAIDKNTRQVTLKGPDNDTYSFTASPEIRNFDQMKVGDHVTAKFDRYVTVKVESGPTTMRASYGVTEGRTFPGDKPGALAAETIDVTAKVIAIDEIRHSATLQSITGDTVVVPVRSDVDLSKYKVGDTVVARVTTTLMVLVATP